ncbi:MAG TPA: Ig-like domain-containing protein [Nocardioides sp.]|nr:Ig-like domain-containing protein [Nocardioides sp.]
MRRLLVALLLSLPLAVAGQLPSVPARADDGATTYTHATADVSSVDYGTRVNVRVWVLAEHVAPTGSVVVTVDSEQLGTFAITPEPAPSTISKAVFELPVQEVGRHEVRVDFPGGNGLAPSSSTTSFDVYKRDTTVQLTTSADTTWVGEAVTFEATVLPDEGAQDGAVTPTGTITFSNDDDEVLGTRVVGVDARASLTTDAPAAGSVSVTATYSGDDHYDGDQAMTFHTVRRVPTTTDLTLSDLQPTYGDNLRIAARVHAEVPARGAPSGGSVEFVIDGRSVATVPVSPVEGPSDGVSSLAVLERADIGAGPHRVTARYRDSADFEGSDARGVDIHVARRATRTIASPVFLGLYPFVLPNAVLRATVTGSSSGQAVAGAPVTFTAGKTTLCTARTDAAGVATCDATAQRLALTLHGGYVAAFSGDADNLASSARGNLVG